MYRSFFTIICILAFVLIAPQVSAAGIAPTVLELAARPGQSIESKVSIINTSASEQVYYLDLLGFEPSDEAGSPKFFNATEGDYLANWISFSSKSVIVPAMSKGDVPFVIAVPDSIPAGGYYAAITVSQAPADVVASNGVIIEAKTASLVLLRVEGDTKEALALLDFKADNMSLSAPPTLYRYRIQNQGNVHLAPTGTILVKNWLGQTIQQFDANPDDGRVLPSSTRSYEVSAQSEPMGWLGKVSFQLKNLAIGPATAILDLTYGSSGTIHSSVHFWFFPWQLFLSLVSLAFVIIIAFTIAHKKFRQ